MLFRRAYPSTQRLSLKHHDMTARIAERLDSDVAVAGMVKANVTLTERESL